MPTSPLQPWIARLRVATTPDPLAGLDPTTFADEAGNRRAIDGPLLAWLIGAPTPPSTRAHLDHALWHALASGEPIHQVALAPSGPLQNASDPARGAVAIEVWTERELAAIQALWTLGVLRKRHEYTARAEAAARWCVQELQPDNATAHPWAVNAFAALGAQGDIEADLYAQTLLHNAQIGTGRPGRFASVVLLASLRSLEWHEAQA